MTRRWVSAFAGGSVLALGLVGCSGGSAGADIDPNAALEINGVEVADKELYQAAREEGELTLYVVGSQDRVEKLVEEFGAETALDVEIVVLNGGKMNERIRAEAAAGKLDADVIVQTDLTLAEDNIAAGALASYCPAGVKGAIDDFILGDCQATGLYVTPLAMGYNSAILSKEDAPTSWQDLIDNGVDEGWGMQAITTGGSSWATWLMLKQTFGVEGWEALAEQEPLITSSAAAMQEAITSGEKALTGVIAPANIAFAAENGAPLDVVIPEEGLLAYIAWTGLSATAKNENAGKVFLNWMASEAGQEAIAHTGEYSPMPGAVVPSLEGLPEMPPLDELIIPETWPEYVTDRAASVEEWSKVFNFAG